MSLNERQIALRKSGNYPKLDDFFDRRRVIQMPFSELALVSPGAAQAFALIDSTMLVASVMAIGTGTTTNAGLMAALLPGAVGIAGSTNVVSDSFGNILNMVSLRDPTTHDPIVTAGGREIFGLVQAVSTANDGDAIGGAGSENMQLSFVYINAAGALVTTPPYPLNPNVEFGQNNVYLERNIPSIVLVGGREQDALSPMTAEQGEYDVTTAFVAAEVITLSTGNGAAAGVSTMTGETFNLGVDAATFNADNLLQIMLNGVEQRKGVEIIWDTSGTMHFADALDVGDYFEVRRLANE